MKILLLIMIWIIGLFLDSNNTFTPTTISTNSPPAQSQPVRCSSRVRIAVDRYGPYVS